MILQARNLHKVYSNGYKKLTVLNGVDINIEKGRMASIVGPSGAGKSTLLHLLAGLDKPTKGEVLLEGVNINKLSDTESSKIRNEQIGFVFQFYHLLPEFNVLENVLMPAFINQVPATRYQARERALAILEQAGLKNRMTHFPNELSGGEQQRVAISRALINNPQMLFCDEPTGNLDSRTGGEIINLIKALRAKNNMTVIMVTHNEELAAVADNIFHLSDGLLKQ